MRYKTLLVSSVGNGNDVITKINVFFKGWVIQQIPLCCSSICTHYCNINLLEMMMLYNLYNLCKMHATNDMLSKLAGSLYSAIMIFIALYLRIHTYGVKLQVITHFVNKSMLSNFHCVIS